MDESSTLSAAACEQYQEQATSLGMSLMAVESTWWGNKIFGQAEERVWALLEDQSEDAWHAGVVCTGTVGSDSIRYANADWQFDVWPPKAHTEVLIRPNWTIYEGEGTRRGTVYAAMQLPTEYGKKVCLWGDTYECLSSEGKNALDEHWNELHPSFEDDCWVVDELNGIVISEITSAGYDLRVSGSLAV